MKLKDVLMVVALIGVLIVGVNYPVNGTTVVEKVTKEVGAAAGTDHYTTEFFHAGLVQGGQPYATSTTNAVTRASAAELNGTSWIVVTPNIPSTTFTLPVATTLQDIKKGEWKDFMVTNGTSTAAITVTIAGSAGTMLVTASSSGAVLSPGKSARVRITHSPTSTTDVIAFVDSFVY